MDTRFEAPAGRDIERDITLGLYAQLEAFEDMFTTDPDLDLAPFAESIRQSTDELSIALRWHSELYDVAGGVLPRVGHLVCLRVDGEPIFSGVLQAITDYRNQSGTRSMSIAVRSRDATPQWREVLRTTQDYAQGTRLDVIARDIATAAGLFEGEIDLPAVAIATAHSTTQLSQIAAWDMLESLLMPAGFTPFFNALGRLKVFSRDVSREPDVILTSRDIEAINGARARPGITRLQLKWRDPSLTRVEQQDKVLAYANITAGFFQQRQEQEVWFSSDHTQRASDTRLVVVQSANSGLFEVCDENYELIGLPGGEGDLHGKIVLDTKNWVPLLLAQFLNVKAAGALPDIAPTGGGPTVPTGKIEHAALELLVFLVLASIGTGVYEVWGTPYDYVHARNLTESYDPDAESWSDKVEVIESDFIANEGHAQAVSAQEFLLRALSANTYQATILDDLRLEPGDIVELPDETRLYITGLSRDLSHGAPAVIQISGFQV